MFEQNDLSHGFFGPALVKQVMTTPIITLAPNSLIEEALEVMLRHSISGLPVCEEGGDLVGLISEYDILMLADQTPEMFSPIAPVVHFMSSEVQTVDENCSLMAAVKMFRENETRRLPVMRGKKVVGMLSRRDIVRVIRDQRKQISMNAWGTSPEQSAKSRSR